MVTSLFAARTNIFLFATGIGNEDKVDAGKRVLDTELGAPITVFFAAFGTLLGVYAVFLVLKALGKGKTGDAIKTAIGGILIAALCFNLSFVGTLTNAAGDVAEKIGETVSALWTESETP